MYHIFLLFLCNYFLKFVAHEMNFEIVKFKIVMLTGRENIDVVDTDVIAS
jgi:hypothetical protein